MEYLHREGYVHRDLKPENILIVDKSSKGKKKAVISDLGLCLSTEEPESKQINCYGSPSYSPPECLSQTEVKDKRCWDCWAFGLIVYTMVTGDLPFACYAIDDDNDPIKRTERLKLLLSHKASDNVHDYSVRASHERPTFRDLASLIKGSLETDGDKRLTGKQILGHRLFESQRKRSRFFKKDRPFPVPYAFLNA